MNDRGTFINLYEQHYMGMHIKLQRADPNISIGLDNVTKAYPRGEKPFSSKEIASQEIWKLLDNSDVRRKLHNDEAINRLKLSKDQSFRTQTRKEISLGRFSRPYA